MMVEKVIKSCFHWLKKVDFKSTMGGGLNRFLPNKLGNLRSKIKYKKCGKLKISLIILFCTFLI